MECDIPEKVPLQLVIYTDDAVDLTFVDGSRLLLTPCGTSFTFSLLQDIAFQGEQAIQQRTQFVTSAFYQPVCEAIDFRNRFSECPFICREIINPSRIVHLYTDIYDVAWPHTTEKARIESLATGGYKIISLDEFASVSLAPCEQHITVEYLAKLPAGDIRTNSTTGRNVERITDNKTFLSDESDTSWRWEYAWVTQYHSIIDLPICWQHATKLLLEYCKARRLPSDGDQSSRNFEDVVNKESSTKSGNLSSNVVNGQLQNSTLNQTDSLQSTTLTFANTTSTVEKKSVSESNSMPTDVINNVQESESFQSAATALGSLKNILEKRTTNCIYSVLPRTLPLVCSNPHKHKPSKRLFVSSNAITTGTVSSATDLLDVMHSTSKVKVVCLQGVIYSYSVHNSDSLKYRYRLLRLRSPTVEIYPGDGSMMRSTGSVGCYFTHFIWNHQSQHTEERMYSVKCPPIHVPHLKYSVSRLIQRGSRFLELMMEEKLNTIADDEFCWKMVTTSPKIKQTLSLSPTHIIEEANVDNIGRFQAASNGRIHIVFADRTFLDMQADLSPRLERMGISHNQDYMPEIPTGMVRFLLPNGHYHYVSLSQQDSHQKYITWAKNWITWVNSSSQEREELYKSTCFQPDVLRTVNAELLKIKCFDYIVSATSSNLTTEETKPVNNSNKLKGGRKWNDTYSEEFSLRAVEEALRQTAATIADIDQLLSSNEEIPVRDNKPC